MTKIKKTRGPWELSMVAVRQSGREAPLVVLIDPVKVMVRAKGGRHTYSLSWAAIWVLAAKAAADEARARRERKEGGAP